MKQIKKKKNKPRAYWTKERCHKKALKCNSRHELEKKYISVYNSAKANKWLDEICSHMIPCRKPKGYWTKEKCSEEAKKYETRDVFKVECGSAYSSACKNFWLDDICNHMTLLLHTWTKEECNEEAKKCSTRTEFCNKNEKAYRASLSNEWIDEVCSHMKYIGNLMIRLVYVYEFSDNHVYVGLTHDISERDTDHKKDKRSGVYKHIKETGITPKLTYSEYMDVEKAKILEGETLEKYKKNGWEILNIAKTGGVGGSIIKLNKDYCHKEAKKYDTRTELYVKNESVYQKSREEGWLNEICLHMIELIHPDGYWNEENCQIEADKYSSRSEFQTKCGSAYQIARKNDWLDDICSHMPELLHPVGYWTLATCIKNASKYKTTTEWKSAPRSGYSAAHKNGWLDQCRNHMSKLKKPNGYWTKKTCTKEAKKYTRRSDFGTKSSGAYNVALTNKWFKEICSHMPNRAKPKKS